MENMKNGQILHGWIFGWKYIKWGNVAWGKFWIENVKNGEILKGEFINGEYNFFFFLDRVIFGQKMQKMGKCWMGECLDGKCEKWENVGWRNFWMVNREDVRWWNVWTENTKLAKLVHFAIDAKNGKFLTQQ